MGFLDSAFNAFNSAVDDVLPGISGAVSGLADSSSASSLAGALAPWAPYVSAGATLLGSMMNNNTAVSLANQQQAFSASQAATIYSRGAQDLANAGINPILAYGSPASMASYSQPNIQPSLALGAGAFSTALEASSGANLKSAQQNLVNAQTTTEYQRPALVNAQASATSAQTAKTKMDTWASLENTKLTQIEQRMREGQIGLVDLQKMATQAQTFLYSASAQAQLSTADLNKARSALTDLQSQLAKPEVSYQLDHPDLVRAGKVSQGYADIAKPVFDLVGSVFRGSVSSSSSVSRSTVSYGD